jgi:hypothetical protein
MKAIIKSIHEEIEVREMPKEELDYTIEPFCPRCDDKVNHYECEENGSIYCPKELNIL